MTTKVGIQGAEFFAYHGFYDEEQKAGTTFLIDAEVTISSFDSLDDNICDTVNYEMLFQICKEEMETTHRLLETVVYNIINRFRSELSNVQSGYVRMQKVRPQLGGKVDKAVVEMHF